MAKITRAQFHKRRPKDHRLNVQVHLRTRGTKPTRTEVLQVLAEIHHTQEIPDGWRFAMIRWNHASEGSDRWRRGSLGDMGGQFQQVWPDLMDNFRIGIVRAKSGAWEILITMKY